MKRDTTLWYLYPAFWWIVLILITGVFYFSGITNESIWYDEAYSAMMSGHSVNEIISFIKYDNHPPLYYILLHFITLIFGRSEFVLRSLSAVAAMAMVSLGAWPVRRLVGDKKAFIFSMLVLCTPIMLTYAHEARVYTLAIFCVTAGVLYGFLAVQTNKRSDWILFGSFSLAAAYFHDYGLIAAGFMHLYIFIWVLWKKRPLLKSYLITGGGVFLAYLPFLVILLSQIMGVKKGFWLGPVSLDGILGALVQPFAYKELYPTVLLTSKFALVFSLALIFFGMIYARVKKSDYEWQFALFVLAVYLGTAISTIVFSLVFQPIFYSRYMLVVLGLFLLLVFTGISLLPGWKWQVAALMVFGTLNFFTIRDIYTQNFNYPFKKVVEYLKDEIKPGDLIITSESYSMGPAVYYFPQAEHYYSNNSVEAKWGQVLIPYGPLLHDDKDRDKLLSEHSSFWYITCNTYIAKNVATLLKGKNTWQIEKYPVDFSDPYSFVKFTATKYVNTGHEVPQKKVSLNLRVTGLKPEGDLFIYFFTTLQGGMNANRADMVNIENSEMTYTIDGLDYRDNMIIVLHDENKNHRPDYDKYGRITEGFGITNMEKVDLSNGLTPDLFDDLKITLNEPEMSANVQVVYPPVPEQKK